jgi:hypothetical protein
MLVLCILRYQRYLNMPISSEYSAKAIKLGVGRRKYWASIWPLRGSQIPELCVRGGTEAGLNADRDHSKSRLMPEAGPTFSTQKCRNRDQTIPKKGSWSCLAYLLSTLEITRRGQGAQVVVSQDGGAAYSK